MILCLDLETSSLNEQRGSVLQVGAVWLHSGEVFFRECRPTDANALIEEGALKVNGITNVHDQGRLPERIAITEFVGWARGSVGKNSKIQICAWNAHFDHRHLMAALNRADIDHRYQPFLHRLIDVHSVLAVERIKAGLSAAPGMAIDEFHKFGNEVPSCDEAAKMLGLREEAKPHNALAGAKQVRAMLRRLLGEVAAQP